MQAVTSLEISFSRPFPQFIEKIHRLLSRSTGLDTLILDLPSLTRTQCSNILKNLHFPDLKFFSAKSFPHDWITKFLGINQKISTLVLSELGGCSCVRRGPLQVTGGGEVIGPTMCVASIAERSPVTSLTASYTNISHTHTHLFSSLMVSPRNVTCLSLDFSAEHDSNILACVAASTPFVRELKLNQKFSAGQVNVIDHS